MKTTVILEDDQVKFIFQITEGFDTVIRLSPNEARNFKAQLEAVLKTLAQGEKD